MTAATWLVLALTVLAWAIVTANSVTRLAIALHEQEAWMAATHSVCAFGALMFAIGTYSTWKAEP